MRETYLPLCIAALDEIQIMNLTKESYLNVPLDFSWMSMVLNNVSEINTFDKCVFFWVKEKNSPSYIFCDVTRL